jgi:hypothetical protein
MSVVGKENHLSPSRGQTTINEPKSREINTIDPTPYPMKMITKSLNNMEVISPNKTYRCKIGTCNYKCNRKTCILLREVVDEIGRDLLGISIQNSIRIK